jgi:nucleosome assembly protein 1-like 1
MAFTVDDVLLLLQVGATIREKLVPNAVRWYTGEAAEDEPIEFGDYDGDEDEEGEEGEEDEDE